MMFCHNQQREKNQILLLFLFQSSPPQSNVDLEKFCHLFSVVISHCSSPRIEIESEMMWGLLPRPLLSAEAGYYLVRKNGLHVTLSNL